MNPCIRMALVLGSALLAYPVHATTYCLHDLGESDANGGTSAAWRTLSKVSSRAFSPGDRILFKAGGSWTGELDLNGDGNAASPIVVDRYGAGVLVRSAFTAASSRYSARRMV